MAAVTWAVGGARNARRAVVVCSHCDAVLSADVDLCEVAALKAEIEKNHHCTPGVPYRPGWPNRSKAL